MTQPTEGSLFAGVMGFGLGFRQAGFRNLWAVEKEPFCQAVIRTQFPETELLTDVRECGKHNLRAVDVITAGFPCQDLSVAGKRAGLEGSRSGLFWEVIRILGELKPAWVVLENVPGLFSSGEGRDFGIVLNALDECGYGVAWRVLNSQFFGVAQRRRRVFLVGCFGKPCPTEVLFESESGSGDIAESGEERTVTSGEVAASLGGAGRSGGYQPNAEQAAGGHLAICQRITPTLSSGGGKPGSGYSAVFAPERAFTLPSVHRGVGQGHNTTYVGSPSDAHRVREFAELPKGLDSARYRALGNAVTVNVSRWIAERIKAQLGRSGL